MQQSYKTSNSLVESTVHSSLRRAILEIGLSPVPEAVITATVDPFPDDPRARMKLWRALLKGEVIATEVRDDDSFSFYVRGEYGSLGFHVRMIYRHQTWIMDTAPTFYPRPFLKTRAFSHTVFAASVVVAAALGYSLHQPAREHMAPPPLVVTSDVPRDTASPSTPVTGDVNKLAAQHQAAQSTKARTTPASAKNAVSKAGSTTPKTGQTGVSAPAPGQTVTLQLTVGMPLYNFAQLMQARHLIKDAMAFDLLMNATKVDRGLLPGTFVFKRGMTNSQLIQVLRNGPQKK